MIAWCLCSNDKHEKNKKKKNMSNMRRQAGRYLTMTWNTKQNTLAALCEVYFKLDTTADKHSKLLP